MLTAYLDTSAFAPFFLPGESDSKFVELGRSAEAFATSRLARVEMHRILYRRRADRMIGPGQYGRLLRHVDDWLAHQALIDVSELIVVRASHLVSDRRLRVLDAIHLASALYIRDEGGEDVVFATADVRLAEAAAAERLEVFG